MRVRRQAAILVLALTLAAPWVAAAEPHPEARDRVARPVVIVSEFLSYAWIFLTSLWGPARACDAGPGADPLGCPAQTITDEGPGTDPLG
jgi:hypothetical protein